MAYARKYTLRRSRPNRRPYRRSAAKRPTRRVKRTYRKKASTKAILNLTSRKKKNTMLQYSNTSSVNAGSVTIGPGPYLVQGANGHSISLFCPSAMDLVQNAGGNNTIANQAERTATTIFMRGYQEKIRIQTSSGLPWFWRRIMFRAKRNTFTLFSPSDTPVQTNNGSPSFIDTSNGMGRLYLNLTINASNVTLFNIQDVLFRGLVNKDWVDPQTAVIDTTRIDLVSDRRITIRSGNASGTVKDTSSWFPCNKNIVYDDDESGEAEASSYVSVLDKQGAGDMFICDIFTPGTGSAATDLLQLTSTSTVYWHEK